MTTLLCNMNEKQKAIRRAAIGRVQVLTTEEMKREIETLNERTDDEALIVVSWMLDVLETRIAEREFVVFCNSL